LSRRQEHWVEVWKGLVWVSALVRGVIRSFVVICAFDVVITTRICQETCRKSKRASCEQMSTSHRPISPKAFRVRCATESATEPLCRLVHVCRPQAPCRPNWLDKGTSASDVKLDPCNRRCEVDHGGGTNGPDGRNLRSRQFTRGWCEVPVRAALRTGLAGSATCATRPASPYLRRWRRLLKQRRQLPSLSSSSCLHTHHNS
jgi:hypothetical protein